MEDYQVRCHNFEKDGNPDGGVAFGNGFTIHWQRGPIIQPDGSKARRNGAFLEDILFVCKRRLEYHQQGEFACHENAQMIYHLTEALRWAKKRINRRRNEGTLGTHLK